MHCGKCQKDGQATRSFEQNRKLSEIKFPGCALLDSQLLERQIFWSHHTRNLLTRISELGHTTRANHNKVHFSSYRLISLSADRGQCWPNNVKIVGIWFPTTTCSLQCQPVEKFWVINVEMHLHRWTNRHAHMHTHVHAHTKSGLTENVKHIRLSLPEKSCLISFCKYHLYTEDDSSCHLSVSPPV